MTTFQTNFFFHELTPKNNSPHLGVNINCPITQKNIYKTRPLIYLMSKIYIQKAFCSSQTYYLSFKGQQKALHLTMDLLSTGVNGEDCKIICTHIKSLAYPTHCTQFQNVKSKIGMQIDEARYIQPTPTLSHLLLSNITVPLNLLQTEKNYYFFMHLKTLKSFPSNTKYEKITKTLRLFMRLKN